MRRVAVVGRLKVSERRAVELFQVDGVGLITTVLATPPEEHDSRLADAVLNGVLSQIFTDAPVAADGGVLPTAIAFRAMAPTLAGRRRAAADRRASANPTWLAASQWPIRVDFRPT